MSKVSANRKTILVSFAVIIAMIISCITLSINAGKNTAECGVNNIKATSARVWVEEYKHVRNNYVVKVVGGGQNKTVNVKMKMSANKKYAGTATVNGLKKNTKYKIYVANSNSVYYYQKSFKTKKK